MGEHRVCNAGVASSSLVFSTMENLIRQALINDLQERYDVVEVWKDDWTRGCRIVFELIKGNGVRQDRAVRWVNITIDDGRIFLDSHSRRSISVDYFHPDSMDKIDEFIVKHCVGGERRRLGQLLLKGSVAQFG